MPLALLLPSKNSHEASARVRSAAEAAVRLYGQNSIVVASLRVKQVSTVNAFMGQSPSIDGILMLVAQAHPLLREAHAILLHRLREGTVLPGSLRREEAEYNAHHHPTEPRLSRFGYITVVNACCATLALWPFTRANDVADQVQAKAFVLAAINTIPRTAAMPYATDVEANLVHIMPQSRDEFLRRYLGIPTLYDTWTNPAVQTVLRARGALRDAETTATRVKALEERRKREDIAKFGLNPCGLSACGRKEASVKEFKLCSACKAVAYCCAEHGALDWAEGHKAACKGMKKNT